MRRPLLRRRGQSTVEFALMIPIIFAILFAVIEYAYYFGAIHYVNYATYAGARAYQANDSVDDAAGQLLTGNVTSNSGGGVGASVSETSAGAQGQLNWTPQMPGFKWVMGSNSMDVNMTVNLGEKECSYEYLIGNPAYVDNNLGC